MIDEERLIDLVRDNEVLYNKTCVGYRLPAKKLAAWAAISRELGATEEKCTKRWISLRERYTRELRKLDAPSGSAPASQPTWHFSTNMAFLKPFIAPRPTRCTINILDTSYGSMLSEQSPSSPLLFPLADENEEGYPERYSGDPVASTPNISKKRKRRDQGDDGEFSEVCQLFKEVQKDRLAENKTLRSFGEMIVASIGETNERKQAKAIQIITNAVMTLKLEPDD
ncbi:PREDICTED: uncharacterized protein LOC108367721 [Rhagoletis zephyria]|uniref:uncharacterized protein LOC108367721 n=1 Tax=Rhagoletis zephyria TaxID=28612 RepID=UPI0008118EA7|nr:PREDICTED: uncharacterized protein LOC108367721 [Rhagoletis zephyria]